MLHLKDILKIMEFSKECYPTFLSGEIIGSDYFLKIAKEHGLELQKDETARK